MPRRFCHSCRAPLHTADKHSECVSCLGAAHAETAFTRMECQRSAALAASFLFREQLRPSRPPAFFLPGTYKEKAAGQRISALGDEWAYAGGTPAYLTLSPQRVFTCSLHTLGPASLCGCEQSGLIRWKQWRRDRHLPLAVSDAEELLDSYHNIPRGLVLFTGSERRLLLHPVSPLPQAVLEIRLRGSGLSIHGPPLRAIPGSLTFTKCLNYLDDWLIFAQSESLALSKCFKGCWASWPQHLQYFSWACFSTGWNLEFLHKLCITDASVSKIISGWNGACPWSNWTWEQTCYLGAMYPQTSTSSPQKTTLIAKRIFRRTGTRWPTTGPTFSFMLFPLLPGSRR